MSNPNESAPKKRAPRAKKAEPSKEESMKLLLDAIAELKQIIKDLKDEEVN